MKRAASTPKSASARPGSASSTRSPRGYETRQERPKSDASYRDVILDTDTDTDADPDPDPVAVLAAYKARRAAWRLAAGTDWPDTRLFFVRPDGKPWHPNAVTQRFRRLVKRVGLPPIRLHDLRHGAATLVLDVGVDIKGVSDQLGHSTTTLARASSSGCTMKPQPPSPAGFKNKRRRTA